jgi:mRNA interferase YafQ
MSDNDKYRVKWSSRFKKDYKLAIKRGYDIDLLDEVIRLIAKVFFPEEKWTDYRCPFLDKQWSQKYTLRSRKP